MTDPKVYDLLLNEVINLKIGGYIQYPTCQVHELLKIFQTNSGYPLNVLLSNDGLQCQALRLGAQDWQSGRLKLKLQFEPDLPDSEESDGGDLNSPLDEIRRLAES